jgi:hypothetical protein
MFVLSRLCRAGRVRKAGVLGRWIAALVLHLADHFFSLVLTVGLFTAADIGLVGTMCGFRAHGYLSCQKGNRMEGRCRKFCMDRFSSTETVENAVDKFGAKELSV